MTARSPGLTAAAGSANWPATVRGPRGRSSAAVLAYTMAHPLEGYARLRDTYGDAVRVAMGPFPDRFLLSRPEHAEHVLATHQDNYVKSASYKGLRALIGDGLLTSEGQDWRRHRRLIQPVFSRRDVLMFGPAMTQASGRLLAGWADLPADAELKVAAQLSGLTLDIIGSALFGADLAGDAAGMGKTIAAGQRLGLVAGLLRLPWGPHSERLLKSAAVRLSGTPGGIYGFVAALVAARRERGVNSGETGRRDLLDVLLSAGAEAGQELTDEEIAAEATTFLLAGHETSSNGLSWTLALLSAYPEARRRLEAEIDDGLDGREPEAADVARLPWTTAVIREALRLYPPAWTIERNAVSADRIAGIDIPAGSVVTVPPYLIHRHPEFWPDPVGFDPARFHSAEPAGQAAVPRLTAPDHANFAYLPFGGGRRACIGQSFAELEMALVLAAITQNYRLDLTAGGMPEPVAGITLRPAQGLPMRLVRR
ncbi:MAG TPA: cytochrome P450 [Streptosporangiaceae bacterium]|nr:cytochrome P450 [Streptosporangiaceae bacterium]